MLHVLKAALVVCMVQNEPDDTYLVVCQGQRERMEMAAVDTIERRALGAFCKAYEYQSKEDVTSFVVVCE